MKKTATLPVVLKPSTFEHAQLELDIQAQAAYALAHDQQDSRNISRIMYSDYYESPVRI
ncbi:hypothetical protein D3C74_474770 [compost metagenome]